jgi:hypothetical protein
MTDGEILTKWLCAECYGRNIYTDFDHGVKQLINSNLRNNTKISLKFNDTQIDITTRDQQKQTTYHQEFFNPHGVVFGAISDAQYVNFFGGTCWGTPKDINKGSYSNINKFKNTQIYFADLREDIVVCYEETGDGGGSASGDHQLGRQTIYGDFGGQGAGCKSIHIYDTVMMKLTASSTGTFKETINIGDYTPYSETTTPSSSFNIASSGRSGYCGGVSYGCYTFGNYAVVDQSAPLDCKEGIYTELVSPEAIENYRNSWDSTGILKGMDDYDAQQWNDFTGTWASNLYSGYPDGVYYYPLFIEVDVLPHGSWCFDYAGNYFYSMITKDKKTFNRLNKDNPQNVDKLKDTDIIYYPLAPL